MKHDPRIYTLDEEHSHRFYQVPKELFANEKYKHLNSDAKLLYALLLDRKELSRKNKWVDEHNQIYLLFSRDNLGQMLGISRPTVTKAFKQLSAVGLIIEERQGLTKPNKIYVCRLEYSGINRRKETFLQNSNEVSSNDTDLNDTEKIKRYSIQTNGGQLISYYAQQYKNCFGKEHPTVTESQMKEITDELSFTKMENGYSDQQVMEMIDLHFEQLPDRNDGKIFAFLGKDTRINPLRRFENDLDREIDWEQL